jgi:hypothetical protein
MDFVPHATAYPTRGGVTLQVCVCQQAVAINPG